MQDTTAQRAYEEITAFERGLQALLAQSDAPAGTTSLQALVLETHDRLLELSEQNIELELSPDGRTKLLTYCLLAVAKLYRASKAEPGSELAARSAAEALIDLEALRHVLRDAIDHEPLRTLGSGTEARLSRADAVRELERWLPRLTADEHAGLLGTQARNVRRWRTDEAAIAPRRAELTVELAGVLRHSWTDEGVLRWFSRPHPMLNGNRPSEVLDDVDWEQALRDAASATRAQVAT